MLFLFYVTQVSLGPTSLQGQWNRINIWLAVTHIHSGFSHLFTETFSLLQSTPNYCKGWTYMYPWINPQLCTVRPIPSAVTTGHLLPQTSALSPEVRALVVCWSSGEPLTTLRVTHNKPGCCAASCLTDIYSGRFLCYPKNPDTSPRAGPSGGNWVFSGFLSPPGAKVKVILPNWQEAAQAFTKGGFWGTQPTYSNTSKHIWPHLYPSKDPWSIHEEDC